MAKIKHIALSTPDADKTARFYMDVFEMEEIHHFDNHSGRGYYLSDGYLNLAIFEIKHDGPQGGSLGAGHYGISHFGFQVDSLEAIAERLEAAGSEPMEEINRAIAAVHEHGALEVKYTGPDDIMLDVSETGWVGTGSPRLAL